MLGLICTHQCQGPAITQALTARSIDIATCLGSPRSLVLHISPQICEAAYRQPIGVGFSVGFKFLDVTREFITMLVEVLPRYALHHAQGIEAALHNLAHSLPFLS